MGHAPLSFKGRCRAVEDLRRARDGARTILIESPDRFARDLAVQLAGHDHLKPLGVALVPASAPDHFTEDTPTAILVRQVFGVIAQFDKDTTVSALAAAVRVGERAASRCRISRKRCDKKASSRSTTSRRYLSNCSILYWKCRCRRFSTTLALTSFLRGSASCMASRALILRRS
jgi:DNA invertase Pin-like site-specific DNA recombinase